MSSSGAAPRLAIVLLSVAAFASAANMRVIDPLLVQLSADFGVTVGAASIAATVFLFANGVFVLVHGPFGDRYGKMPVVTIACLAAAGCSILSALAGSWPGPSRASSPASPARRSSRSPSPGSATM